MFNVYEFRCFVIALVLVLRAASLVLLGFLPITCKVVCKSFDKFYSYFSLYYVSFPYASFCVI
jgi:hypothetical protein